MTIKTLNERILKNETKINKAKILIEKKKIKANKMLKIIESKGFDPNDKYCKFDTEDHQEAYWLIVDKDSVIESIENNKKKIIDITSTLNNQKDQLKKAESIENVLINKMPEIFKEAQMDFAKQIIRGDVKTQNFLKERYIELGYSLFIKEFTYSRYLFMSETIENITRDAEKTAESYIIDLYNRIKEKTGDVKSYNNIHYSGKGLNGFVTGEKSRVNVETIIAGGYNIQKMHYRTLVHEA